MADTFKTVKEFNKQYDLVRKDILERHGYKEGDKVRLKNAIMLYQDFNGQWVNASSTKTDMIDRIKMYSLSDKETSFKLQAMV